MSTLTELRTAIDEYEQLECDDKCSMCDHWEQCNESSRKYDSVVTVENIHALIAVAEAAEIHLYREGLPREDCDADCQGCAHIERCEDLQRINDALSPLVKEADDG